MNFLENVYYKSVAENDKNLKFWEDYHKNLGSMDFSVYSDKLTVPVLVPIGKKILFRGELKHTNEVTVSLGADYFAKCSLKQANVIREHRIKDAQEKIKMYQKEREYFENQMSFSKHNIFDNTGEEIIEDYSEEEDKAWRKKHKENVKKFKMQCRNEQQKQGDITDEELWNRLEELELQEELENELQYVENVDASEKDKYESIISKNNIVPMLSPQNTVLRNVNTTEMKQANDVNLEFAAENSKVDLLQKVLYKQNELQVKLQELKDKEKGVSRTESELIARLDEMEQLDELEDEIDRLDDIIDNEDVKYEEEIEKTTALKIKRSVLFADEDDSETLEITFEHSDVLPSTESYNPAAGIQKPSDVYDVYSSLLNSRTTSILKNTKYECNKIPHTPIENKSIDDMLEEVTSIIEERNLNNRSIVVKDVVERQVSNQNIMDSSEKRPTSLFKKKRMQNKS